MAEKPNAPGGDLAATLSEFEPPGSERAHRPPWYRPTVPVPAMIPPNLDAVEVASWFGIDADGIRFSMFLRLIRLGRKPGEPEAKEWTKLIEEARRGLELAEARAARNAAGSGTWAESALRTRIGTIDFFPDAGVDERNRPTNEGELIGSPEEAAAASTARQAEIDLEAARTGLRTAAIAAVAAWSRLEIGWAESADAEQMELLISRHADAQWRTTEARRAFFEALEATK
jgi:hypothetical protein